MEVTEMVKSLAQYGVLGLVAAYFIFKDWARNKADREDRKAEEAARVETCKEHNEALKMFQMILTEFKDFLIRIETKIDMDKKVG